MENIDSKTFHCEYKGCSAANTTTGQLNSHYREAHECIRYHCPAPLCESLLARRDDLKRHLRKFHPRMNLDQAMMEARQSNIKDRRIEKKMAARRRRERDQEAERKRQMKREEKKKRGEEQKKNATDEDRANEKGASPAAPRAQSNPHCRRARTP